MVKTPLLSPLITIQNDLSHPYLHMCFMAIGNYPEIVCKHLPKLYDSLAKLHWKLDGGKSTKQANEMVAKDGEEMVIHGICDCTGKV